MWVLPVLLIGAVAAGYAALKKKKPAPRPAPKTLPVAPVHGQVVGGWTYSAPTNTWTPPKGQPVAPDQHAPGVLTLPEIVITGGGDLGSSSASPSTSGASLASVLSQVKPPPVGPYPGPGAWKSNKAYVERYQEVLSWLASHKSKPAWDPHGVDGNAGTDTMHAVEAFQRDNGISPADGEAGSVTATKLDALLAAS